MVAWRKLAEIIGQYLKKGSQVYIEGRLQTRSWEGQDGKKNYRTEIVAENMIMLGRPGGSVSSGAPASLDNQQPEPTSSLPEIQIDNSDIPF